MIQLEFVNDSSFISYGNLLDHASGIHLAISVVKKKLGNTFCLYLNMELAIKTFYFYFFMNLYYVNLVI